MSTDDHTVLKFRPRRMSRPGTANSGLSSYDNDEAGAEDYRHRMATNAAAFVFTAVLAGAGIWLAVKLADLRTSQDCVLMGRADCAHLSSMKH